MKMNVIIACVWIINGKEVLGKPDVIITLHHSYHDKARFIEEWVKNPSDLYDMRVMETLYLRVGDALEGYLYEHGPGIQLGKIPKFIKKNLDKVFQNYDPESHGHFIDILSK